MNPTRTAHFFENAVRSVLASRQMIYDSTDMHADQDAIALLSVNNMRVWDNTTELLLSNFRTDESLDVALQLFIALYPMYNSGAITVLNYSLKFEKQNREPLLFMTTTKVRQRKDGRRFANLIFLCVSLESFLLHAPVFMENIEILLNNAGNTLAKITTCPDIANNLQNVITQVKLLLSSLQTEFERKLDSCSASNIFQCLLDIQNDYASLRQMVQICNKVGEAEGFLKNECGRLKYGGTENKELTSITNKMLEISTAVMQLERMNSKLNLTALKGSVDVLLPSNKRTKLMPFGVLPGRGERSSSTEEEDYGIVNYYNVRGIQPPLKGPNFEKHLMYLPARICIVGPSGSGKTNALMNLLQAWGIENFTKIILFTGSSTKEPLYQALLNDYPGLIDTFSPSGNMFVPPLKEKDMDLPVTNKLIIFDDFVALPVKKLEQLIQYSIASRKYGFTCVFIGQKFAGTNGIPYAVREQCGYFIMIKQNARNRSAIYSLAAGDVDKSTFINCANRADSREMHFLTIDKDGPPNLRLRLGLTAPCGNR